MAKVKQTAENYSLEMTDAVRKKNKLISNETMVREIKEAESEIVDLEQCQEAYAILAKHHAESSSRRMYETWEAGTQAKVEERKSFIKYLKMVLSDRGYPVSELEKPLGVMAD